MCHYEDIKKEEDESRNVKFQCRTSFLRQLLVCSGVWMHYFVCGLCFGAPTVLIPQLRRANNTQVIDDEIASWLCSVFGFAAIPWVFVIPLAVTRFGRRTPFIIISINILVAFIAMNYSDTPLQILTSEILQGMNHAANVTISVIIISEYTSPRYRGMFLTIKSATFFWGVWVSNAIGTFFHWKYIALFGIVCSCYTFVSMLWPESPQWLASKGRFDDCRRAHSWLNGVNEESKAEVEKLIVSQAEYLERRNKIKRNPWNRSKIIESIVCKQFYIPVLLSILMVTQYHLSGKYVCSMYAIDIIKKITNNESTAYAGMLILDGVTVFGMYIGCFLSKILKRRTLYLTSSSIGIAFLFIIATYLYLVKLSILSENKIASISLLIGFSVPISCGPMIMTTSIYGEIIPLRFKTSSFLLTALISEIYSTSFLKIAPFIFKTLGLHGAFLFYGISAGICTFVLYIYLPETKDKTLQEIEEYFKGENLTEEQTESGKPLQCVN